jgi:hypothetical protein
MNVLFSLISELDGYTLGHIQQKLESDGSKIFELFKLYKASKGKSPDDEKIKNQLYGSKPTDMGVLYRLKNRLVHHINQALIELNTAEGKSAFMGEQHLILYRIFQSKGMRDLAEYYLLKSIKYAEVNEQYSLLDIIYGEMISFCKDSLSEDPDIYIQKRRANFKMFNTLRTMDEILAVMTYRLKSTQNLSGQLNVTKEIDKTLRNFASDKEIFRSTQFKIKFYKTVSQILVQQQKFDELEKFILETRADFIKSGIFNKQTHDIKIEQLVYLTNALLFQRKFDSVIETGKLLYKEILDFDKLLFNKYIYFYYQAQINSYAVLDIEKAIELQAEVLEKGSIIKDAYFIVFNYANLAFLYFLKNNYKQTVKTLQKVYLNDYYPKIDISLKVELALLELMARYDLADVNTFEYRLAQVQADLAGDWKEYDGIEKKLLDIIVKMSTDPNYSKNKQTIQLAKTYVQLSRNNTNRVFNFENWVIAKLGLTQII